MNDYVQRPNSGTLWHNKYKKHEKAADFKGSIYIDKDMLIDLVKNRTSELVEVKLDGWKGKDKNGNPYVNVKIDTYKPQARQYAAPSEKDPWE